MLKPSFRLNPEKDKDLIELLESIPERCRSEQIKKWIREGIKKDLSLKSDKVIKWNFPK